MRNLVTLLLLGLLLCHGLIMVMGYKGYDEKEEEEDWRERERERETEQEEEDERGGGGGGGRGRRWPQGEDWFLLHDSKRIVQTEAGEVRVVRSLGGGRLLERQLHIGFITMEPKSLYVPQYIDSNLILFIRRGIL